MQFSLRAVMVVVILVSVSTGWYMHRQRCYVGLEVDVPAPLGEVGYEVPGILREYWNGAKLREHDRDHPWPPEKRRIRELREDVSVFDFRFDVEVLKTHREELISLARKVLGDERSDFISALVAVKILDETGDPDALSVILNRVKNQRAEDDGERWRLFDFFPDEKLLADHDFLKFVKASVGQDSGFSRRSESALFHTGLDRQPWLHRRMEEARLATDSDNPFQLLISNAPSAEVLELAEAFLFDPRERTRNYSDYYLMRTLLMTDFSDTAELVEIADRIESRFADVIRNLRKQNKPEGHLAWRLWQLVVYHGSNVSKDLFLETLENPELHYRHTDAIDALVRLGHGEQCREYISNAVLNLPPKRPARHLEFLNLHEQCCGRESSIKVCTRLAKEESNLAACEKLASLFESSHDPGVSNLILEQLFQNGHGAYAVKALRLLEQVGNSDLATLWAQLPESTTSDPLIKFYQHWHTQGIEREDIVSWVNQTLKPKNPISVDSVLNESKFLTGEREHYLWRFVHEGFDNPHKFTMSALAHSGSGDLAFGEDWEFGAITGYMAELGETESGAIKVSSVSSEETNGQRTFGIAVNNRLYEFTLAEPVENYERRYDARAIVELLNAIAIRRGLTKRFFAYPTEWDRAFCLVMFIEPEIVAELEKKFGLVPVDGCDFYVDH